LRESSVLWASCPECEHQWTPYGEKTTTVPYVDTIKCPKCKHEHEFAWMDESTGRKFAEKKLGLLDHKETTSMIGELTTQIELQQKELDLEKNQRVVLEGRLDQLVDWKNRVQHMLDEIQSFYDDEKEFREDNK